MAVSATYIIQPVAIYGAPVAGTDAVQTLTIGGTPTGGSFRLAFEGHRTAEIPWTDVDATLVAAIDAALEALPNIGTGGITAAAGTLSAGIGTVTLTFAGPHAKRVQPLISVPARYHNLLGTSPTLSVVETTPGVDVTGIGMIPGAVIADVTTGAVYKNTGSALQPAWTVI